MNMDVRKVLSVLARCKRCAWWGVYLCVKQSEVSYVGYVRTTVYHTQSLGVEAEWNKLGCHVVSMRIDCYWNKEIGIGEAYVFQPFLL